METAECAWKDLFNDSERTSLNEGFFITERTDRSRWCKVCQPELASVVDYGLILLLMRRWPMPSSGTVMNMAEPMMMNIITIIGFVSVALGLWLNWSILMTNLILDRSYRNLANFTLVACLRRALPLIAHNPVFSFIDSSSPDTKSCEYGAFLETFLAVLEIEWLTHVCIERYVVAKYTTNGWPIQKCHYILFQFLCLFFASLYSFAPLIGIGRYNFDFSCSFCTFDVILPESWKRYIVVTIFIIRSIKPAMVMSMMLIWARILENKFAPSDKTREHVTFTKNVIIVTVINQICWSPIALIRGSVIISQLMSSHPVVLVSASYVKWAMLIHWISPALTTMVLFAADKKIREKMLLLQFNKIDKTEDKTE